MDARVFDRLTRQLGRQAPRRALGGLLAVLLSMLGLATPAAGKRRRRNGRDGARHRRNDRHAREHGSKRVQDEKKKKKRKKKKKAQPQSPPPPGNASPPPPQSPPPQSPPPPGGGGGDISFNQQVYETCLERLAPIILDHLDLACADDRCATEGTEDCTACVLEILEVYLRELVACMSMAVTAADAPARQRARDGIQALAAVAEGGKLPISVCDGSRYVFEKDRALADVDKPARDLLLSAAAAGIAVVFKRTDYATIVAVLKAPSDLEALRIALQKLAQVEDLYGCRARGVFGQCIIEHPGPPTDKDDGVCCPLPGAARLCGGTCCYEEHCESCSGGVCQGCTPDSQYCREQKVRLNPHEPIEILTTCAPCEACTPNVCERRSDTPADRVPGSPDCGSRSCSGPCGQGKYCLFGQCQTCPAPGRDGKGRNAVATDECCVPKTCAELGVACGDHDDGCGGTVQCGGCPSGKRCEAGACVEIDPCATRGCRWTGTFRQKWTFHGVGIHNEVTTLDVLQDVTYDIHANALATVTSTQSAHWHTDDPNICEHLVKDWGWELPGHTGPQVYVGSALSCLAPDFGSNCTFNYPGSGEYTTVQQCTTCSSGTCCTPGCEDVGVAMAPGTRRTELGTPTGPTLSGSDTVNEDGCSFGFCGTSVYERTWSLTYGPID